MKNLKNALFLNSKQLQRLEITKIIGGVEASYKDGNSCVTWQDYKTGSEHSSDCNGLNSKDCASIVETENSDIVTSTSDYTLNADFDLGIY